MWNLFKKSKTKKLQLKDLNGQPFGEGARVKSLRYDLGECEVHFDGKGYLYQSDHSGESISHTLMIDATTGHQKVILLEDT